MKKKILILAALIISITVSFSVGVLYFTKDNISNRINDRDTVSFTENGEGGMLLFRGWKTNDNGTLVSTEKNASVTLRNVDAFIKNIRIDGIIKDCPAAVIVYIDSEENYLRAPVSVKNDDIYIEINAEVTQNLVIVLADGEGTEAFIQSVEINPTKLNFNVVTSILFFFFTFAILYSFIEIYYSKAGVKKDILAMKRYRYLLSNLVAKDIKTKYRRSVLGVLWSILNPLLMMLVLTAVFSNIIRVEVEGGFSLFYLTGYIMFNFISESTGFSLTSIINASGLIKKVYIPKYIFPLEKTIFSFVNMLFSLSAFIIVFIFFLATGGASLKWTMLLFFVPMIYLFVFTFGLNLILSTANVFFRDVGHIWGVLLTVWMYASPIIYPITLVPDWLKNVIRLNPLYYYIDYFRALLLTGRFPSLYENVICILFSVSVLILGLIFFHKKQDKFVLYI